VEQSCSVLAAVSLADPSLNMEYAVEIWNHPIPKKKSIGPDRSRFFSVSPDLRPDELHVDPL
jgi:hypothetical protein